MKRYCLQLVLLFACCLPAFAGKRQDEQAIRALLQKQVAAWNTGNIAGYMVGYWQSDSLVFIGKSGPTYGYAATLARYQKSYPDAAAMGALTSDLLSLQRLSKDAYFAIGRWGLKRKAGDLSGSWTLLFRRIGGKWVIVCDHSS